MSPKSSKNQHFPLAAPAGLEGHRGDFSTFPVLILGDLEEKRSCRSRLAKKRALLAQDSGSAPGFGFIPKSLPGAERAGRNPVCPP